MQQGLLPAAWHAADVSPVHHIVLKCPLLSPLSTCMQEDEKPDNFDMSDMQNLQQFGGGEWHPRVLMLC